MVVHLLSVLFILLLGQGTSSGPVSGRFDTSVSVRDSQSCDIYYSWLQNELSGTWELEQKQCPDALYFEPTLNACKPADQLVTKCSDAIAPTGSDHRRSRQLMTREKKYRDQSDDDDWKNLNAEIPGKAMSPSNPDESQSGAKLPFRRGSSARQGTKRRKNGRPSKRKNAKKNWVAIFVRGCRFGDSPFEEDEEQPDEQMEEDETENQTNDNVEDNKPNGNQTGGPNNNELGDGSNENGPKPHPNPSSPSNDEGRLKPSPNCTCNDNNQSTTSKPGCNHTDDKDNLSASNSTASPAVSTSTSPAAPTSTSPSDLKDPSGSTPANSQSKPTTAVPNHAEPSSTNKPTNSPIRENSPSSPKPSPLPHYSPQPTTPAKPAATSARPPNSTPKPRPSKIVLIPLKIRNPNNSNNSTKIDEREALRRFLEELKKKRPTLSKESEKQLAMLFKAKVRGEDEKIKETVAASYDQVDPSMVRSKSQKEPDVKNLKLDKIEEEIGVELSDAFEYYTKLADKSNSTDRRA